MLKSKLNLCNQDWVDTIFEGRNKSYGAYNLRVKQSKRTLIAFAVGATIFSLLVSIPTVAKYFSKPVEIERPIATAITLTALPPPELPNNVPIPPTPPPVKKEITSIIEIKKFTALVAAPEDEVIEDPPTQIDLRTALAGAKDIAATEGGDVIIELPEEQPGPSVDQVITETLPVPPHLVQVKPDYPGGMAEFYKFIAQNYVVPEIGHLTEAKIYVSFVVEKDGSITDIQVLRDVGYGTGKEAIRVLSKMPKWSPGIQNGRPVRVAYQLPITIKIQ